MAEVTDDELERGAITDASRSHGAEARGPARGGVALADEGADELPALLAIAVGIAILVIALVWPSIRDRDDGAATDTAAAVEEEVEEAAEDVVDEAEDAAEEAEDAAEEVEEALPDIPAIQALLDESGVDGLTAEGLGTTVILTGVVPDEDARNTLIDLVSVQPDVAEVDATGLTVAEADDAAGAAVEVAAAQTSIVLTGTVPDEATREALVARAVEIYSEEQVDDQLVVDEGVEPPVTVSITGSLTDPVLFDQVVGAFEGVDGVEVDAGGFVLEESSDLEAALNGLEPIQFASGSAAIQAESQPILDEAAELLLANPDVALEIGGHTDSIGDEANNQTLSEARAQSVLAALQERGVENQLEARGFGEQRLKVTPDENDPEAQQENRRIEFRIL